MNLCNSCDSGAPSRVEKGWLYQRIYIYIYMYVLWLGSFSLFSASNYLPKFSLRNAMDDHKYKIQLHCLLVLRQGIGR